MSHRRFLCALTLFLGIPTLSAAQSSGDAGAVTLQPGDVLKITVWETPALSGEFEVAPDSSLRHPIFSQLRVVGVPIAGLKTQVTEFLRSYQREPLVSIEPLLRVTVGGDVRAPDIYLFAPEVTVSGAVARAGGATDRGRLDRVLLERDGRTRTVDLTKPDQGVITVRSGDHILVGRRREILRDYVGPAASVLASILSIINLSRR